MHLIRTPVLAAAVVAHNATQRRVVKDSGERHAGIIRSASSASASAPATGLAR